VSSTPTSSRPDLGFTLIELLTSIGAIVVLIALVIHAATAVKAGADKTTEMAAARSLGIAWTTYATDHRGAVLPGYAAGFRARTIDGEWIDEETADVAGQRWPLRLAPYLGHNFSALYSGDTAEALEGLADSPTPERLYLVSTFPAFGLNSVYVGGDTNYGGYSQIFLDTFGPFYSTRISNIRRPDRLVVFSTSRSTQSGPGNSSKIRQGFFRVLPPNWATPLWAPEYESDDATSAGFVSARHMEGAEEVVIVTAADGGVSTETVLDLRDMRRWSNLAQSPDSLLEPVLP
jgi:type II secretory pathway pseudopilin PulG